jgi:hypothetical protein
VPDIVLIREVLSSQRSPLSRAYASHYCTPVVTHVDPVIFVRCYFADCMQCTFCHDWCCSRGCDADPANIARLTEEHAEPLEAYTGRPREEWFESEVYADPDLPGGRYRSSRVVNGTCVFHNPHGRGCGIHAYALASGIDYHAVKPMLCWLFPLTIEAGALVPQNSVLDRSLVCGGEGLTLYASQRPEVLHLFGPELVAELDHLEKETLAAQHTSS